jgi:DNA polymerase I-like protein with 3'-5' exonuclease and polymerase domains
MHTSYFAKYRNGPNAVSIAFITPPGFTGRIYKKLAPPGWLLRHKDNPEQYEHAYWFEVLDLLDPTEVYKELGPDAVLLCWEGPDKFCHRRLVAEWLENSLKITVKELDDMGSLTILKQRIVDQHTKKSITPVEEDTPKRSIGNVRKKTPVALKPMQTTNLSCEKDTPLKNDLNAFKGYNVNNLTNVVLPMGYHCIGSNEVDRLMQLKKDIQELKICAFDYESDADPDDEMVLPHDQKLTMVSFACRIGQAFCMPIAMDAYAVNWDLSWLIDNFLKPILEDPEITIVIQNCKYEHQQSLINAGIDMFPKACMGKIIDTMIEIKALALPETTVYMGDGYEVQVGLKPATKALLADANGLVHGIIHVDDIKSFEEIVGRVEWEEPTGELYKSGKNKGLPKMKKMSRSRTFNELPIDQGVINYSCADSDWALGLHFKLMPMCISEGIYDTIVELDVPRMMVLGEYELAGWTINVDRLEAMGKQADEALKLIEPKLYESLLEVTEGFAETNENGEVIVPAGIYGMGERYGEPTCMEIKTSKPFSWGSTQHLQWLFYHVLKVSTSGIKRSKETGLPSTDKKAMEIIMERYIEKSDNKFIEVLKEKRKYDKIKSTYVDGMLPYAANDMHKLYTSLKLVSTWRLASKKPNLQNLPRADNDPLGIRGVFEAPTYDMAKDYSKYNPLTRPVPFINLNKLSGITVYVGADYSQIELKVLAWYAGEQSMIDTLANGGDLHSKAAKDVFKLPCTVEEVKKKFKPYRYRAKKVNFGLVYGMTEYGLSEDKKMGMTVSEAAAFIEQYMMTYPGVRGYQHDMIDFARKTGYVETMFHHRRPIPDINHPNKWVRQAAENKAMNTPIQGSAADIIALAMVNIRKEAPRYIKPVIQIHDELIAETPVEYAAEAAMIIKEIMERPIEGFSEIMPITAEPYMGKIWKHALDIEWDDKGPFVKPKEKAEEATDVTYDDIAYAMSLYKMAGIEVR